jgi:hypothetical protein
MRSRAGLTPSIVVVVVLLFSTPLLPLDEGVSLQAAELAASDSRQVLRLLRSERDAVRAEMRQMLASVSGVVGAVSAGDLAAVEKAARTSGMSTAVDPRLERKLPKPFLEMGERTHRGFDDLGDAAKSGVNSNALLARLASVMSNCITCHATYRLPDGP